MLTPDGLIIYFDLNFESRPIGVLQLSGLAGVETVPLLF